jgi:Chaperone of endosialidase
MKRMTNIIYPAFTVFALASFALSPAVEAVSPAPDGGYPGGNTAEGQNALFSLTSGGYNTAVGFFSLRSDTTGQLNTAIGAGTLLANTADQNTASGAGALLSNTIGGANTADGAFALFSNTTGSNITAIGSYALESNTADENTAVGSGALASNTTGTQNTAFGINALTSNTTAGANGNGANTAFGAFALSASTTGGANTAIGYAALAQGNGGANTAIGDLAGFNITGNGNIDIGFHEAGVAGENNTTRIGNIGATAQDTGIYVTLDGVGGTKLGYVNTSSSRRFKQDIKPMGAASEGLFALKPVNFRYKPDFDPNQSERFGLIAEDVEKVNPALVARDDKGNLTTVRYEAVNAMLLNEFLKEHRAFLKEQRKVDEQDATISQLKSTVLQQQKGMEALAASVKEQALKIQKVSAQIELNKLAPRVAFKNQ